MTWSTPEAVTILLKTEAIHSLTKLPQDSRCLPLKRQKQRATEAPDWLDGAQIVLF